jgi:hypothetical protein
LSGVSETEKVDSKGDHTPNPAAYFCDPIGKICLLEQKEVRMLTASKWILIIAGVLLIIDSIVMFAGIPNPVFGWPLPCPVTLLLLGVGIILFGISNRAFERV